MVRLWSHAELGASTQGCAALRLAHALTKLRERASFLGNCATKLARFLFLMFTSRILVAKRAMAK